MKYYYYKIEAYDHKKQRYVRKRDPFITTSPLLFGHPYYSSSVGSTFRIIKLLSIED